MGVEVLTAKNEILVLRVVRMVNHHPLRRHYLVRKSRPFKPVSAHSLGRRKHPVQRIELVLEVMVAVARRTVLVIVTTHPLHQEANGKNHPHEMLKSLMLLLVKVVVAVVVTERLRLLLLPKRRSKLLPQNNHKKKKIHMKINQWKLRMKHQRKLWGRSLMMPLTLIE